MERRKEKDGREGRKMGCKKEEGRKMREKEE